MKNFIIVMVVVMMLLVHAEGGHNIINDISLSTE